MLEQKHTNNEAEFPFVRLPAITPSERLIILLESVRFAREKVAQDGEKLEGLYLVRALAESYRAGTERVAMKRREVE